MREFVSKTKKMRVTIEGVAYEMRCPNLGESEMLQDKIKGINPDEVMKMYLNFFEGLGLPIKVCEKMDSDDFIEFIKFVINPNSQGSQPT